LAAAEALAATRDRPREISVTEVADLMADPYGFYARRVLRLTPLDPLDAEVGAADYGQIVHAVLASWTRRLGEAPGGWPGLETAARWFDEASEEALAEAAARPGLLAFWRPRLSRIGGFVVAQEAAQAEGRKIRHRHAEVPGHLDILQGAVRLKVRADRLDELADRTLALIDYKTGTPPSAKEITDGRAPQMPLEAAIAEAGGFSKVEPAPVSAMAHWRLTGGGTPGEVKPIKGEASALGADALDQTAALARAFLLGDRRFVARPHPGRKPRRGDHDHLARVAEWGAVDES
ncbi:PD-(D/E)XK nuclease family protein, partial [Teichococcus deserti]|uniref:PD-(D/E)XK nuclease family protein n=1 Tax=Teichococcus deserti TaxID=1817963 RepID=UPI001A96ADC7